MPPKRKSLDLDKEDIIDLTSGEHEPKASSSTVEPARKKARKTSESDDEFVEEDNEAESSTAPKKVPAKHGKGKAAAEAAPSYKSWHDVVLEGEGTDEGVPVYDDCNDIRRKIRVLQKTPGWKVTHWLAEIGNINSNSFSRFMKASGPSGGAENGTYLAAYEYFEKVRIFEKKKKTPKRIRQEEEYPNGMPLQDRRRMWVIGPR